MIISHITEAIGNTPLLRLPDEIHGLRHIEVFAKLEYLNPFGSLKDRVAWGMLRPIIRDLCEDRKLVVEASSGNTGKALCAILGTHGLSFRAITNRIRLPEVRMMLQLLGGQIEELPRVSDCPDPNDPQDFWAKARDLAAAHPDKIAHVNQYFNERNLESHYQGTAKELIDDLGEINFWFGFLGTCGSTVGVGRRLREVQPSTKVWGVVSAPGEYVPGGRSLNELYEVGFFNRSFFDQLITGTRREAVEGMLVLNRRAGLLCGPTSGVTFRSGIKALREVDRPKPNGGKWRAAFIVCDRAEPYLSYVRETKPEIFNHDARPQSTVGGLSVEEVEEAPELSLERLQRMRGEDGVTIIDIRTTFSFALGTIQGAINLPAEDLSRLIENGRIFPINRTLVLVCPFGTISRKYVAFLKNQGYDAYSLAGGFEAYKRQCRATP